MRRSEIDAETNQDVYQDFRVHHYVVEQWLRYLENQHPTFLQSHQVTIDYTLLQHLPEDEMVQNRLRTVKTQEMEYPLVEDAGPPEDHPNSNLPNQQDPHCSQEDLFQTYIMQSQRCNNYIMLCLTMITL
jgi:hypothetical protein